MFPIGEHRIVQLMNVHFVTRNRPVNLLRLVMRPQDQQQVIYLYHQEQLPTSY